MARLKKGYLVFRDIPPEHSSPKSERRKVGYRHVLVDWMNRALLGTAADREAAERLGALIKGMNDCNTSRWSDSKKAWIPKRRNNNPDGFTVGLKSLSQQAPWYKFTIDLSPWLDGIKWFLVINCEEAPSGDGHDLRARWEDGVRNPELEAVEAVVHIALDGHLGTIRRCEVGSCRKWFLTKDDTRVRCCPDHDVDDLRKGTLERKKQVNAAAKKARDRDKAEDEQHWNRQKVKDKLDRTHPHR
jgi:hypothetical protein